MEYSPSIEEPTEAAADETERGLTDAEVRTLKYCFSLAPTTGDKRILASIRNDALLIRPKDIVGFRKILADHGLGDSVLIAGIFKWLEEDAARWLCFRA